MWLAVIALVVVGLVVLARPGSSAPQPQGAEPCFGEPDAPRRPRALERTFLLADLVGFTALAEAVADAAVAVPLGVASIKGLRQPVVLYELKERASIGGER